MPSEGRILRKIIATSIFIYSTSKRSNSKYIKGVPYKCIHNLISDYFENNYGPITPTTDNPRHTVTPGKFTWCSPVICEF